LKEPTGERAQDDMNEKAEMLWILTENVRHTGSNPQTKAIDLLLAVYFRVTSSFGKSSLYYCLPI